MLLFRSERIDIMENSKLYTNILELRMTKFRVPDCEQTWITIILVKLTLSILMDANIIDVQKIYL